MPRSGNTTKANELYPGEWDYLAVTYPSDTQEVFTYRSGGVSGTVIATVTINYTDSKKCDVSTVVRT